MRVKRGSSDDISSNVSMILFIKQTYMYVTYLRRYIYIYKQPCLAASNTPSYTVVPLYERVTLARAQTISFSSCLHRAMKG